MAAIKGDDHRQHLLKVGREGFAVIDEFFPPRRIPPLQGLQRQRQFLQPHAHTRHVSPPKEAVLNCLEAAEIYGGTVFLEYRNGKPAPLRKVYH